MSFVTDTHALIWHMSGDPRLSRRARERFRKVDRGEEVAIVPTLVCYEILVLIEKGRIPLDYELFLSMVHGSRNYRAESLSLDIVARARSIPGPLDPLDRLIASTALHLDIPLVSKDRKLNRIPGLQVFW